MKALRRDQRRFTLIEVLISMSLMTIVLGATLTLFEDFSSADRRNDKQNESQDRVRHATDKLARDLRNLASPTNELPLAVDKAEPYDLVFKAADPTEASGSLNAWNTRRVRYCLDSSRPNDGRLWAQTQTWTSLAVPALPATLSCPDTSWSTQTLVADNITNTADGQDRPVFFYNGGPALEDITGVKTELFVDVEPGPNPAETRLSSGVFLRNQNRVPTAQFNVVVKNGALLLNGSASTDPEGDNLKYEWWVNGARVGTGVVLNHPVPGTGPRAATVRLTVSDSAGLKTESDPQVVTVQ